MNLPPSSSPADLQIWNNAVFDNAAFDNDSRQSWGSLKSVFDNPNSSFDSLSSFDKENQSISLENHHNISNSSSKTTPFKPVNADKTFVEKSRTQRISKVGFPDDGLIGKKKRDEKKIDEEIEEIESKISVLSSRLEALRVEKAAQMSVKGSAFVEKRGPRIVPAKFMEQKPNISTTNTNKNNNTEELIGSMSLSRKSNSVQRRGLSLGPAEIVSSVRRGRMMSMGPSEILGSVNKSKKKPEMMMTMITPSQNTNRRKSCFYKLQDIDEEEKVGVAAKGKSCSVSPKSRKVVAFGKAVPSRQAVTTIGTRKAVKKEDSVISSIQPKKLFKDGEKSAVVGGTSKKPLRPGRVVASRYNSSSNNQAASGAMRKRSLPDNDKDENDGNSKKRSLSAGKGRVVVDDLNEGKKFSSTEIRVKKRWEIPSEIVVHGSGGSGIMVETEVEEISSPPPQSIVVNNLLPRIRVGRCVNETPRDSGPAKKVVELIGKKSFFANDDEDVEASVCQELTYAEDGEEES